MAAMKKYSRQGRDRCFEGNGDIPFYANILYDSGRIANYWIDSLLWYEKLLILGSESYLRGDK